MQSFPCPSTFARPLQIAVRVTHSGVFNAFSQASLVSDPSVLTPPMSAVTGDFSFPNKAERCTPRPVKRVQSSVLGCRVTRNPALCSAPTEHALNWHVLQGTCAVCMSKGERKKKKPCSVLAKCSERLKRQVFKSTMKSLTVHGKMTHNPVRRHTDMSWCSRIVFTRSERCSGALVF